MATETIISVRGTRSQSAVTKWLWKELRHAQREMAQTEVYQNEVSQKILRRADESMAKFSCISPKPPVKIELAMKPSISSSSSCSSSGSSSIPRPPCERDNTIDDGETLPDDGAIDREEIPQTIVVRTNTDDEEDSTLNVTGSVTPSLHGTGSGNVTPSLPKFPDDYLPDNESGVEERDIIVEL